MRGDLKPGRSPFRGREAWRDARRNSSFQRNAENRQMRSASEIAHFDSKDLAEISSIHPQRADTRLFCGPFQLPETSVMNDRADHHPSLVLWAAAFLLAAAAPAHALVIGVTEGVTYQASEIGRASWRERVL